MKKRILMILVTLTLLSSMILCALLGVTKAEYFKILSKDLSFEAKPDLELEYYIYHAKKDSNSVYAPERGTYTDSKNFIQWLRPGNVDTLNYTTSSDGSTTSGTGITSGPSGAKMVYQIKVPVNETGYYTLDFLTYILLGNDTQGNDYLSTDFYTISYRYCLGCEVLTQSDNIEFGSNTPLNMPNRVFADDSDRKDRDQEKVLYSDSAISNNSAIPKDSVYQWKTLCPYRAENVSLTFKAEQADVDKGYVIWAWDFTGLQAKVGSLILNYALYVENLSVNKRMELDGTTKYRDSNTPYFMFPQTAYVNNTVDKNGNTDNNNLGAGRNRWSSGRGTYVTEATDNSLGMRAELLWGGTNRETDNPVSLYIPLKNVQRGATYKVTFDFSVARQGAKAPDSTKSNGVKQADKNTATDSSKITDWHNYNGDVSSIFDNSWSNAANADNRIFQSYLISGDLNNVASLSRNGHRNSQDLITYNNKYYSYYNVTSNGNQYTYGYPLTKYDEVVKYNNDNFKATLNGSINHTTSSNINDTYSIDVKHNNESTYTSTSMRNFFNAVQHTEYNGQYEINWVTFYNTTFSFNIASDANLDELYWVWAIDALRYSAFYNLRIENVRIERVVEFASELDANGVKIGNNQIGTAYMDNYGVGTGDVDAGPFNNYRGWNSTGQNYQARGHATTTYLPKGNIYAPIVDASRFTLTNDFTIKLDGKAVLKGSVDRYVYSIDGGRTWADMDFSGGKASEDQLKAAEAGIDLSVKGQTPTDGGPDMIGFNSGDAYNASFDNFALSVDLNKYKHQANLDIIIAAVPDAHPDYRCEILRIVNFNQIKNYLSFPYDFVSDIEVTNKIYNTNGEKTPLNAHRIKDDSDNKGHYYYSLAKAEGTGFTQMKTVRLDTKVPTSTTCYSRTGSYSHAYEDVRAAWTGFAVKRTLGITGWAMAESGIQKYVWSADGGKTWSDCSGTPKERDLVNDDYEDMFYDASSGYDENLEKGHCFRDSIDGEFDNDPNDDRYDGKTGQMLTADLSGHVGEVLDVIFAAKPTDSEVYVPIGRVDNVAVYGDPKLPERTAGRGMGTFCTHMNEVRIDDQAYQHGISMSLRYDPTDYSNSFARTNWIANASLGIETATLNYLEPYHVNPVNARFFNETVQEVNSGGKIEIEGFTVVEGGVKRYKYSLDGGETWTILHTTQQKNYSEMWNGEGEYAFKTKALAAANACGISLDGDNGNNVSYTHEDNAWLVVNLPALPAGVEKNLLVVAESNIPDNSGNADSGFIYPVLQMKIRIKNEGVGYFFNDANGAQAGRYTSGNISQTFKAGNDATYKLTFPVSKEGVHTLTFNFDTSVTKTKINSPIYQSYETTKKQVGTGTVTMSVDKTNFIVGEPIYVSYSTDVTAASFSGYGNSVLSKAIIGIFRVNEETDIVENYGQWTRYERGVYVVQDRDGLTANATQERSGKVELRSGLTNTQVRDHYKEDGTWKDLPAGKYRIYFVNDEDIGIGNIIHKVAGDYSYLQLTDPIDITIHSAAEYSDDISISVLHEQTEKGGERYFGSKEADKSKGGTVDNVANREITNAFTAQDVDFYFNATAEDVKRGYVVLDFDLSKLTANANHVLNINNLMYGYGVKSTKRLVTDENGNASYTIRVPALEVGTHNFAFSSYTSAYSPIIHEGLDQSDKKVDGHQGSNYKTAGAYMSVPKTVYNVGEPIHVSYSIAGAQTDYGQWIGISRAIDGRDAVIAYDHVHDNGGMEGVVTLKPGISKCEVGAEEFANLPAGDYKIYFRDFSANIYRGQAGGSNDNKGVSWPECNITDPIAITIIDPNESNEKPYKQTYYFDDVRYTIGTNPGTPSGADGYISVDKTVFHVGEDINFTYNISNNFGNATAGNKHLYIGICKPNGTRWNYAYLEDGKIPFNKFLTSSKGETIDESLVPGRYQLICCDGSFEDARKIGSVMAVIDIVILPAIDSANPSTLTMSYDHYLKKNNAERVPHDPISAYDYSKNLISIDITQADVDRGYVEFEYELAGLVEKNTEVIYTTEMFYEKIGYDPNFIYERRGDYLYFGLYPQTLKPENVNILLKDGPNDQGYYKGNDGYLYAQVVADSSVNGYKFANDSRIISGSTYYFRVEPLKWRIVGESDGDMTVICESIINAMEYGDSNNYEESAVRDWLVDEFYNTAFNASQKALIKIVNVDNSAASTGYDTNSNACANTNDMIYLPSYSNVKNYSKAEVLSKTSTDFARALGSYADSLGKGSWMLRSPLDSTTLKVSGYDCSGRLYDANVDDASNGVVPMLKLSYKFDDPNTQVGNDAYIVPPPGDKYGVTGGSSYGVSHENVLTSNFAITKGTSAVNATNYPGASISVDKVYYEYGEDIPIKYKTPNKTGNYRVYITMDEKGSAGRYGTWVVKAYNVNANAQGVVNLSNMTTELHSYVVPNDTQYWNTLPPGEYKIWLYDVRNATYPYGTAYNQYHKDSGFITESLSIKILPPGELNPDFSVTHYSDWEYFGSKNDDNGENWTSLTLDKTVFKQGEKIRYYIDGSWEHKWVGVFSADTYSMDCDKVEDYSGKDKTWRYAQWGHKDHISGGSNYLETETLTPGQYKIVYVFGLTLESAWAHEFATYNDHLGTGTNQTRQRVMTVIDITILPEDCGNQTVTVNYTRADGTECETSISRPIHFFTPISFDTVLDSVRPGSSITFTTTTSGTDRTIEKIIRTNVSAINYQDADAEKPYIRQGDYVYFGEYPQSLKADSVTVYTEDRTDARGYYRGSDGFYYAAVAANPYNSSGYTFKNGKPIENGNVYYFKVEPIKWRIVSEDQDQNMVLICESILQNNMFDATENIWRTSDIREWLNNYFIDKAFINLQKSYILNTSIDDENDKLYLPSKDDVLNPEYEFDSNASAWDTNRQKLVTDYARATGAFADMTGDEGSGNGIWMLRTPADNSATNFICDVSQHGEVTNGGILVNNMAYGVAPMLKLSYSKDAAFYEEYITIEKEVGNKDIYRANYSALLNIKQDQVENPWIYNTDRTQQVPDYYKDSYMKVSKTYFNVGEPINVEYRYNTKLTASSEKAWICIATMGNDDKTIKDTYIRWKEVTRSTSSAVFDITKAEGAAQEGCPENLRNLPAGEYKIWFIYGPANTNWWDYSQDDDDQNYNNPYINGNAVTEPICIKIVGPDDSDTSLEYKAWIGKDGDSHGNAKYAYIKLEKNVFTQGEPIKAAFKGRTEYMYAWLHKVNEDNTDVELRNYTDVAVLPGIDKLPGKPGKYIEEWSDFYPVEKSDTLEPGQYKLYYAVYPESPIDNVFESGAIVANIDITILPKDVEAAPTLKLDVVYTNKSGQTVRQTINNNVLLNNLLNSHPGNYDLTDNDNKIEGIVELTDVMPNTIVQFVFSYKKDGEIKQDDIIEIAVDEASAINDIEYSTSSNIAVEHQAFSYVDASGKTHNDYAGSKLSLPSMYFEYGQPIEVSYKVPSNSGYRVVVTKEFFNKGETDEKGNPLYDKYVIAGKNLYATVCIKYKNLSPSEGTVNLNQINAWNSPFLQEDYLYSGNLPVGTYKVWLVKADADMLGWIDDDNAARGQAFAQDPYTYIAPNMVTEPITINVIDPKNPNFGIMSNVYSVNNGKNQVAGVEKHDSTRIGIDKTVFVQGEPIYFHIQMDYSFRHIMLMKADLSITDVANEPTKGNYDRAMYGKTWRYAVDGYTNGEDFLDTTDLEPGHYKLYYLMGKNLQAAIRGDRFYHDGDSSFSQETYKTYSELLTVIDIIILPKDATQTLTVTYTKYDGTTATVTESFSMTGKALGTELHNGKLLTKYHSGIDFAKTITDAQPGTSFVFTVTTNFNVADEDKYLEDRFTYTVLKKPVEILS